MFSILSMISVSPILTGIALIIFWSVYLSARSRPISESLAASCCPRSNSCLVTNCCWQLQPHLLLPNSPLRPPLFRSPRAVPAMPSQRPLPATPFGRHQSRTSDSPPQCFFPFIMTRLYCHCFILQVAHETEVGSYVHLASIPASLSENSSMVNGAIPESM